MCGVYSSYFFKVLKLRLDTSCSYCCHIVKVSLLQTLTSVPQVRTRVHLKIVVSTITAHTDVPVHLGTAPHQIHGAVKVCET